MAILNTTMTLLIDILSSRSSAATACVSRPTDPTHSTSDVN